MSVRKKARRSNDSLESNSRSITSEEEEEEDRMEVDSSDDKENRDELIPNSQSRNSAFQESDGMNFSLIDENDEPPCSQFNETDEDEPEDEHSEARKSCPAECGTIEKVILQNFMCHKYFEVDLSSRVNFIIGRNGSGKSAILAGIVIALGGKITAAARGHNLSSLIKNGESSAKVTVQLCNDNGYNRIYSYKYEEYGASIVVERLIRLDSPATYTIRTLAGKIISRKREDLLEILSHFDIQITNPVCVLSQEMSRNFLNSKNPKDKYDFFMKATNLEKLRHNYALANDQNMTAKKKLEKKKLLLPVMKEEVDELKRKVKLLTRYNEFEQKKRNLGFELLWAVAAVYRKEKEEVMASIDERSKRIEKAKEKIDGFDEEVLKLERKKAKLHLQVQDILEDFEKKNTEINASKEEFKGMKSEKADKLVALEMAQNEMRMVEKNERILTQNITDLKKRFEQYEKLAAERDQREARKQELAEENEQLKELVDELTHERTSLSDKRSKVDEDLRQLRSKLARTVHEFKKKESELRSLEASSSNYLRKYGDHVVELVAAIERDAARGRYKKRPYGPLGAYIRVKDKNVSLAAETILKGNIHAFTCDNLEDAKTLEQTFRTYCRDGHRPRVITRQYVNRHSVEGLRVECDEYSCLLDYLDFKEDPVYNVVLDMIKLESILYIPDHQKARDLMIDEYQVPHNCKQSVSKDGTITYPQGRNSIFRSYALNDRKNARYLVDDVTESINELKQSLQSIRQEESEMRQNLKELEISYSEVQQQLTEVERNLRANQLKFSRNNRELKELTNVDEDTAAPVEITALEEDLENARQKKQEHEDKICQLKEEYEQFMVKFRQFEQQLTKLQDEIDRLLRNKYPLQDQIRKIDQEIVSSKDFKVKFGGRLSELETRQEEDLNMIAEKDKLIEREEAKARAGHAERIETNRTPEDIDNEIRSLEAYLKERDPEFNESGTVLAAYEEKKLNFAKLCRQIGDIEEYLDGFTRSIKRRSKSYLSYRLTVSNRVSTAFESYLKMLNFTGSLKVFHTTTEDDHGVIKNEKTLEIKVNPKSNDLNNAYADSRSLSGGERSFSTIAFLLSLWEYCTSPFNVLDEIDVFMDMITRHLALDALIESANRKLNRQYIFLSPLPPEKKNIRQMLKIVHMPEPERGRS